ncbi:MAG: nitroreductase family protein [Planctomycetota bacterium]
MPILDLMAERYSVRKYQDRPVSRTLVEHVLEAGRLAPSACNLQPWHVLAFDDPAWRQRICACYRRDWLQTAPVLLVICGDRSVSWKRRADGKDACDIDIGIFVDHLTLAAVERGLGTCWICAFDPEALAAELRLPARIEPLVVLPLGYPADEPGGMHQQRRPLKDIVHWNHRQVEPLGHEIV